MKLPRVYTSPEANPLDQVEYEKRQSVISNADGSAVFEAKDVEVPKEWSQLATDILVSKYFRRAGVPNELGRETSARQTVHRIAHSIRRAGELMGTYFDDAEAAETFEAELAHMLINQIGAFNSPVWFNCGLFHEYGIVGGGGNWAWSFEEGEVAEIENNYSRPQCSACFIQSVQDDLMSIFDLLKSEAKIFKYGSGTGTNFSRIRGHQEKLSGGGTSSGLMSFLEVFDRGAGATKSGGTTRRAAKMVCLDMDHPEIREFIQWKVREERKARTLIEHGGFAADFNGEAYRTVSGQNSNNSVRVTDDFMQAALEGKAWRTRLRTTEGICEELNARELFDEICEAAWACADPGVQFDTTINKWHTCPNTDRIRASNPCSEYMFLDDSACNLASLNLMKFLGENGEFDVARYRHAVRIFLLAQEILVDFSSYPTERIARNSHDYRPLGLGYANLGALLMVNGIPYDSPEGVAVCGALTAIMTGHAYRVSAEIASRTGAFPGYAKNEKPFMRVMRMHRDAVDRVSAEFCPSYLLAAARDAWDEAIEAGQKWGYRNAQATVLAPTGTIGLLMDCDTTGIEPDFALVKIKKLAGGGYFKIVNQSVPAALRKLGYTSNEIRDVLLYMCGTLTLRNAPHVNDLSLKARGFSEEDLANVEAALRSGLELPMAFSRRVLGAETLRRLGITEEVAASHEFNLLRVLGFTPAQITEATEHICGTMTVEGAPHLREEHLPVFDCANRCGRIGRRFIAPMGHVRMMAAAQPFISGAISKTVNVPNDSTVQEIREIYVEGWKRGLKAVALYRDGCKMSQPLSSGGEEKKAKPEKGEIGEALAAPIALAPAPALVPSSAAAPMLPAFNAQRRKLPARRRGTTVESRVAGHKIYLRTGEFEDGTLGEIFIDMHKEGAAFRSLMNCFAIAVSKGLQYGVPLSEFVDTYTFTRFEPQGPCDHPNVKMATSVVDFVFRVLGLDYLGRADLVQVPPAEVERRISMTESAAEAEAMAATDPAKDSSGLTEEATAPAPAPREVPVPREVGVGAASSAAAFAAEALDLQLGAMMGDAPFCDVCGHITVRSGACYKCLNCGNSMGCS